MDLATLIGIALGSGLLLLSIALRSPLSAFADLPSVAIVLGGTLAATLTMQKLSHVMGAFAVARNAFLDRAQPIENLVPAVLRLAGKARKEGLMALEGERIDDPFLAQGVRLGIDGLSPDLIHATLQSELAALKVRHDRGQKIFRFLGTTAPSMGMVGTLIGLVQMLRRLDDPAAIGPGMAVALLTTFYGAVLAFLVFGPIAEKLAARTAEEVQRKQLAIAGVDSILRGESSFVIQSKLEAHLSPRERGRMQRPF
jgi:chemotaxis protein MotA